MTEDLVVGYGLVALNIGDRTYQLLIDNKVNCFDCSRCVGKFAKECLLDLRMCENTPYKYAKLDFKTLELQGVNELEAKRIQKQTNEIIRLLRSLDYIVEKDGRFIFNHNLADKDLENKFFNTFDIEW